MELAHSLLLNEEAYNRISDSKRPVFIYEWLRFLDKVLVAAQKSDIKESQKKLVEQLTQQISENPGPPTRKLLARCLATIFSVGDTFALFETINKCNDIVRSKNDAPSYLATRLAAIACIGGMYEKLGRMVGRSYEETVALLIKGLKNAESQGRQEIMITLTKIVAGIGSVGSNCHKEIYRAAKGVMTDRSLNVRCAAAACLTTLVTEAAFMCAAELENVIALSLRALDGSNYDVRCDVGRLMGALLARAQQPIKPGSLPGGRTRPLRHDEALAMLSAGFLRGGSAVKEMIKGNASINREVRVGVTHAYVELVRSMGAAWVEQHLAEFITHVLGMVGSVRSCPTHVDAVYARKCVTFILRSVIGGVLGEKAQIQAAKEICQVVVRQMSTIDIATEQEKSVPSDTTTMQHVLVCALAELGCLVESLGTSAAILVSEPSTGIIEPVVSVLIHPTAAARLAASWCLRSIAVALPSQLTILIERCMTRMHHLKSSPEAVGGYSFALASLLGGVRYTSLGIPHAKGKQIFTIAEELLRTASQNSRLSLQRTQSGWLLLGALMTLGVSVVRAHLPRMLLLWRNAFPRSTRELESEKARGDAFSWQVTLEGRAGALGAMESFVSSCPELVTDDVIRRLLPPLECALTMTAHIPSIIKLYGAHLKASAAMVRLRLYDVLAMLPPNTYEGAFSALLRELVAEFTLTDNPANTTTSLLRAHCHVDDSVILGSWLQETDHKAIEDQLQPNSASGSGALEHDPASLYRKCPAGQPCPGPLPLGVAVIDSSVRLYGQVFPRVAHKHRLQMLQHFIECIRQAKSSRQQAVQINIFTAVLCALKCLADTKQGFGQLEVRQAAVDLVLAALTNSNPVLRCAAGEALGRMAQVAHETKFVAEMAQYSFDKLKSARDVVTRTGHSLALGCLHRYVGGMGSGQHLSTSVSVLLALAQDTTSPQVQVWALHALALIADSGGPMFRAYVEPSLSLVLQLLLAVPLSQMDVHQCLGKCLAALITTIGPELQGNQGSVATARLSCLVCCAVMQDHADAMVQAEAVSCLQQLHLFAPRHVNLTTLVPHLCATLHSSHLLLRRAAVACLRQLAQREAREVCDHALTLAGQPLASSDATVPDTGLEGLLFALLDTEADRQLVSDVQDTLVSMLQALAAHNLTRWLLLIKDVLQASSDSSALNSPAEPMAEKDDEEDDAEILADKAPEEAKPAVAPRWPTRVFAIQCLLKVMTACKEVPEHCDYIKARSLKLAGKGDYLVLHLSELVRMAFIAATSDSDQLRLAGLSALDEIISTFASAPEPEFPGHVILEQYQAQVGAALRPAFTPETAPDVTAAACDVCSHWIGSGVARDLNDLRRVHQLLVSSLGKLQTGQDTSPLFSESANSMEKLAVLKAWAEVYICAMDASRAEPEDANKDSDTQPGESLLSLVQPEMLTLSRHWLHALRDHALLSLPAEYSSQLPPDGGAFYTWDTMDASRPHYRKAWPAILYAAALWLRETGFTNLDKHDRPANMKADETDRDRFHLLLGICVEALCSPTSTQPQSTITLCLRAMYALLDDPWPRARLGQDHTLGVEVINVLHRLLLTRENDECLALVIKVAGQVLLAAQEALEEAAARQKEAVAQGEVELATLGEGGATGDILPGESIVFAALEVCLCILVRRIPGLNPALLPAPTAESLVTAPALIEAPSPILSEESSRLVVAALGLLTELPSLCSPKGSASILASLLHLITGVLRECGTHLASTPISAALACLKELCQSPHAQHPDSEKEWRTILRSATHTILNLPTKTSGGSVDESVVLLGMSVMLISAPRDIICVPSLLTPATLFFQNAWDHPDTQVRGKCVQTLTSVLQRPDPAISTPFIHVVVPRVLNRLLNLPPDEPNDELELSVLIEGIKMAEVLVLITPHTNRVQLLLVLVPLLVSLLREPAPAVSTPHRALHDTALQRLVRIAPQYPVEFRQVMTAAPQLRTRLENAVKATRQGSNESEALRMKTAGEQARSQNTLQKPSIKLKTDFSNFGK